jgi:hypothetical protein
MSELIQAVVTIKDPLPCSRSLPSSCSSRSGRRPFQNRCSSLSGRKSRATGSTPFSIGLCSLRSGVFLVLCGIAVLGQVLNYKTAVRAASVEDLKEELAFRHADDTTARHALEEYQKGLALAQNQKLSDAIGSLESSLKAVPTAAARETLALRYQKVSNRTGAIELAEKAVQTARETGGAVKTVRAERLLSAVQAPAPAVVSKACPSGAGLIGPSWIYLPEATRSKRQHS